MEAKRHTCIICKSKKAEHKMLRFRSHWACVLCFGAPNDLDTSGRKLKVLNLYSGIGGNRKNWQGNIEVTAVEYDPRIAAQYKRLYPGDNVVVSCAHEYLIKNYWKYDFIWSSPPCPTHSRLNYTFGDERKAYFDMSLYQEIILLKKFFKGRFTVENVIPYYESLVPADYFVGRHCFWSNFPITEKINFEGPGKSLDKLTEEELINWLGIRLEQKLYVKRTKKSITVYRNCLHPVIGESIFNDYKKYLQKNKNFFAL